MGDRDEYLGQFGDDPPNEIVAVSRLREVEAELARYRAVVEAAKDCYRRHFADLIASGLTFDDLLSPEDGTLEADVWFALASLDDPAPSEPHVCTPGCEWGGCATVEGAPAPTEGGAG